MKCYTDINSLGFDVSFDVDDNVFPLPQMILLGVKTDTYSSMKTLVNSDYRTYQMLEKQSDCHSSLYLSYNGLEGQTQLISIKVMIGKIPNPIATFLIELNGPVDNMTISLESAFDDVNLFVELTDDPYLKLPPQSYFRPEKWMDGLMELPKPGECLFIKNLKMNNILTFNSLINYMGRNSMKIGYMKLEYTYKQSGVDRVEIIEFFAYITDCTTEISFGVDLVINQIYSNSQVRIEFYDVYNKKMGWIDLALNETLRNFVQTFSTFSDVLLHVNLLMWDDVFEKTNYIPDIFLCKPQKYIVSLGYHFRPIQTVVVKIYDKTIFHYELFPYGIDQHPNIVVWKPLSDELFASQIEVVEKTRNITSIFS